MSYQLSLEISRKVDKRVLEALESNNVDESRPAAIARLLHRLHNSFQRIDDEREIDLEYVTCAEYQLFVDDMRAQGRYLQPDHWRRYEFPSGFALQPIRGIRPEDAESFCRWLTQRHGGVGTRYRLPSSAEVNDFPALKGMTACWCRDTGQFQLAGLAINDEQRIREEFRAAFGQPIHSLCLMDVNRNREASGTVTENFGQRMIWPFLAASLILGILSLTVFYVDTVIPIVGYIIALSIAVSLMSLVLAPLFSPVTSFRALRDMEPNEGGCLGILWCIGLVFLLIGILSSPYFCLLVALPSLVYFMVKRFSSLRISAVLNKIRPAAEKILSNNNNKESDYRSVYALIESRSLDFNERLQQRKSAIERLHSRPTRSGFENSFLFWRKRVSERTTEENVIDVYWWLQIVVAREEDKLPSWEGIRLVREYLS